MIKYVLIVVLNTPFVVIGLLRALHSFQKGRISRARYTFVTILWTLVFVGLLFAQPLYQFLERNRLTDSTPLSVFDVVLTTGLVLALSLTFRLYSKIDRLDERLMQLNRELSIRLSTGDQQHTDNQKSQSDKV